MPEKKPFIDESSRGDAATNGLQRQRILVLGASGFIGRRVVQKLAASDWAKPIAAWHRSALESTASIEARRFDATHPAAMQEALHDVAGVVNCITGDGRSIIASAQALFDAGMQTPIAPRIVHLSTMMVYGTATGLVDETTALRGDWDDYSAAKSEVERLAGQYPSVVQLRPGIVYGPGSPIWSGRIGRWLIQHRLGDLGNAGVGICNLVHIDDVVEAVIRSLRMPNLEGQVFNLSLNNPPTWNDYFGQYAAALGTTMIPISYSRLWTEQYLLAPPLKLAEYMSRFVSFRTPPEPIRPWFLRLCAHPLRLDVRRAEAILGMKWIPLGEGLRQAAAWLLVGEQAGRTP